MRERVARVLLPALLLLTVLAYLPGLRGELVLDDKLTVEGNQSIRHLDNFLHVAPWARILGSERTLTQATFALNYAMARLDPLPYHVTNLAIHLVTVVLAYLLLRRILVLCGLAHRATLAWVVAGLFALHPLQTQAVVYVSQRAESLASLLYIAALLLLLGAERRGLSRTGIASYLLAFAAHVFGLGTKSIGLTMPLAFLLLGALPARAEYRQRGLVHPATRLALAVPFVAYTVLVIRRTIPDLSGPAAGLNVAGFDLPSVPTWHYFMTQWKVIVTYLRLIVLPAGQNLDWDYPIARSLLDVGVLQCGLFLTALVVGSVYALYRFRARGGPTPATVRAAAFGICWFFLVLSQSSSFVPRLDLVMEHRVYLASLGVFLAVVVLADRAIAQLVPTRARLVAVGFTGVVFASLATATYARAQVWRTRLGLWTDVCAKSPQKARAHANLAGEYHSAGKLGQAIEEYRLALKLADRDPVWVRARIQERLAAIYLAQGRLDEAIAAAEAGLAEYPDHSALLGTLALAYLQRRDLPQAKAAAEKSVRTAPNPAVPTLILGLAHAQEGDAAGAAALFEQAVKLEPELPQARLYLAAAYRGQGRPGDACNVLQPLRAVEREQPEEVKLALAACLPQQ